MSGHYEYDDEFQHLRSIWHSPHEDPRVAGTFPLAPNEKGPARNWFYSIAWLVSMALAFYLGRII